MVEIRYEDVLEAAGKLDPPERLRLASALFDTLTSAPEPSEKIHSILELRGLGKEIWAGVDPDRYVHEERSSWKE
jgi:hypothetical protein